MSNQLQERLQSAIKDKLRRAEAAEMPMTQKHLRREAMKLSRLWNKFLGTQREQEQAIRECRAAGI